MLPKFEVFPPPCQPGLLFVDHETTGRSGHLGHALVEIEPGHLLAFFANCSDKSQGHNGDGWMEYRRSTDGGRTWSDPHPLSHSKNIHTARNGWSSFVERAVRCADGSLLAFTLECGNTPETRHFWRPLKVPQVLRSADSGRSWSEARPVGNEAGRIFDAIVVEGEVLTLSLANDSSLKFVGHLPEHHYSLWVSGDQGQTFERRSILPLEMVAHFYGTLTVLPDGALAVYIYDERDEFHLITLLSRDGGRSWEHPFQTYYAKRIRNQKIAAFRGGYIMHGRTGSMGEDADLGHLVLYTSCDGLHWDEGRVIEERLPGTIKYSGAYSNSVVAHDPKGVHPPQLLIQSSHAYRACMTNIRHRWLI